MKLEITIRYDGIVDPWFIDEVPGLLPPQYIMPANKQKIESFFKYEDKKCEKQKL